MNYELNDNFDKSNDDTNIYMKETKVTQTFCISRHLNSCNNMVDSASWTNVLYKFEEPPLSLWGIISGLALQREPYKINKFREINRVYVSCLVRTWMTAIIEYLPYCSNGEISLIVSPYIKEADISNKFYVGQSIDKGNMPIDVKSQIEKIKYFFLILKLVQKYIKIFNNKNQNNDKCKKIEENIDKILTNKTKINIIFPPYETIKNRKQVKINYKIELIYNSKNNELNVETYLFEGNNKIKDTGIYDDTDPYSIGIRKENDLEIEINDELTGGSNLTNKQQDYFNKILKKFLEQNENNSSDDKEIILSNDQNKKINIKKTKTKNSSYIGNKPRINIYTKSFGKEAILLFIDWIRNMRNDKSEYIYVVAHSNIMQASLYNICSKLNNDVDVNKKNVDINCKTNGLQNTIKQNIWEIIIEVNDGLSENKSNLYIKSVKIRQGQDKPKGSSKKELNYNREKELTCGNNINNIKKYIEETPNSQEMQNSFETQENKNNNKNQEIVENPPPQQSTGLWNKFKGFFFKNKQGGHKFRTYKHHNTNKKIKYKTCKNKNLKKTKINKKRNFNRKMTYKK